MDFRAIGVPAPYLQGIEAERARLSQQARAHSFGPSDLDIILILVDSETRWAQLVDLVDDPTTLVVALLPTLEVDAYARALACGASGVVYADTSSEIVLLTIDCALHGEVILPSFVARDLALPAARPPVTDGEEFGSVDELLIRGIIGGRSIEALAEELSYSDRTVRRFVQNLMIRCGCTSRAELIVFGVRQGYDS